MHTFHCSILSIFPEMFPGCLGSSLAGKALKKNIWSLDVINIRDFGVTKHKNVDDSPYGGGNGLVMRPDVLGRALDQVIASNPDALIYYPSPRGAHLTQEVSKKIACQKNIIILCGRFEGVDERILDEYDIIQISIGDYILSGGEVAAFVILDSVVRLLPGVLKKKQTLEEESFECIYEGKRLIEFPLYTRPSEWRKKKVPDVLLNGNHSEISKWKIKESLRVTKEKQNK